MRSTSAQVFLLLALLLFALVLLSSYGLEAESAYLLPRVVASFGLAVTSLELVAGFREPPAASERPRERKGVPVLVAIGFAALYFFLVPWLGFSLATGLAVVAFGHLSGFARRKLVVALAVVVPAVLHLAFAELLKAPLPAGVLGALLF